MRIHASGEDYLEAILRKTEEESVNAAEPFYRLCHTDATVSG